MHKVVSIAAASAGTAYDAAAAAKEYLECFQ